MEKWLEYSIHGVSYENPHVSAFLTFWNTYTSQFFDATLISEILPLMPTVASDLEKGIKVLDVGCGYGHSTNLIAKNSPNSTITGYDFSKKGIQAAKDESKSFEQKKR